MLYEHFEEPQKLMNWESSKTVTSNKMMQNTGLLSNNHNFIYTDDKLAELNQDFNQHTSSIDTQFDLN